MNMYYTTQFIHLSQLLRDRRNTRGPCPDQRFNQGFSRGRRAVNGDIARVDHDHEERESCMGSLIWYNNEPARMFGVFQGAEKFRFP